MEAPLVVFIHLDLGIGGAESLILNLAKATIPQKHCQHEASPSETNFRNVPPSGSVSIYTTHCSPSHCYDEVRHPSGALSSFVKIRGSWIPRKTIFGGTALFSAIRILYLTFYAMKENPNANVFVLDVLPIGVPYLVDLCNVRAGVLFYCHFPDKLLTRDTVNGEMDNCHTIERTENILDFAQIISLLLKRLKRYYRWVMDTAEEWAMSYSDLIVVNSKFTMEEVKKVYPSIFLSATEESTEKTENSPFECVKVLYPAIESSFSKETTIPNTAVCSPQIEAVSRTKTPKVFGPIVSLNRFERKKNVSLLLYAYDVLLQKTATVDFEKLPPLIIAGGYDPLNIENVEHLAELRAIADQILKRHNLPPSTVSSPSKASFENYTNHDLQTASVAFYPSITNDKRRELLSIASVLCYTPYREHFGIVPLEAMDAGVPVVAIRSGGPMETIEDGVTGILVDYTGMDSNNFGETKSDYVTSTVKDFADAIASILSDREASYVMGIRGKERVHKMFGMTAFRTQWWDLLLEVQRRGKTRFFRRTVSYPKVGYSVLKCLLELLLVLSFTIAATWILKRLRWLN